MPCNLSVSAKWIARIKLELVSDGLFSKLIIQIPKTVQLRDQSQKLYKLFKRTEPESVST